MNNLTFDSSKYRLGPLCKRGHDWEGTGRSLKRITNRQCVQCQAEQTKHDRKANPEKYSERGKKFYAENRESVLERQARFKEENREHVLTRQRLQMQQYRKTDEFKAKRLEWLKQRRKVWGEISSIPENIDEWLSNAISTHKSRAKRVGVEHIEYSLEELKNRIFAFNGMCAYCKDLPVNTIDHFVPMSQGGMNALSNILPSCGCCNSSKGNDEPIEWYEKQYFYDENQYIELIKLLSA
jgi:5-methylcytosine-specific restriction endonuclease McrA